MKLLADETNDGLVGGQCAVLVMDTVPLVMRTIRHEMRRHRPEDLSLPQFHALRHIDRHDGASLSHLAAHLDLTLASASKLVDGLVKRGLVTRETALDDRRRAILTATASGREALQATRTAAQTRIAELLAALSPAQRVAVTEAMLALRGVLSADED